MKRLYNFQLLQRHQQHATAAVTEDATNRADTGKRGSFAQNATRLIRQQVFVRQLNW